MANTPDRDVFYAPSIHPTSDSRVIGTESEMLRVGTHGHANASDPAAVQAGTACAPEVECACGHIGPRCDRCDAACTRCCDRYGCEPDEDAAAYSERGNPAHDPCCAFCTDSRLP